MISWIKETKCLKLCICVHIIMININKVKKKVTEGIQIVGTTIVKLKYKEEKS